METLVVAVPFACLIQSGVPLVPEPELPVLLPEPALLSDDGLPLPAGFFFTVTLQVAFFLDPSLVVTVIVTVPDFFPVTTPWEETVATLLSELFHVTALLVVLDGVTVGFKV